VKVAARILASSSHTLEVAVRDGAFRQDLYFRLNVVILRVPPLREHKSDIPLLVNWFLGKHQVAGQAVVTASDAAMRLLMAQDWPGNVEELENCLERALAMGAGPVLRSADLALDLQRTAQAPRRASCVPVKPLPQQAGNGSHSHPSVGTAEAADPASSAPAIEPRHTVPLADLERQAILHAVMASQGDRILAAQRLGIGKTTVYRKLKEYGAER
jgi:DNA-binding NtrC family response regulator